MNPIGVKDKVRIPMPTNHYSLQAQIVNYVMDIDFEHFLESNPSAKVYYEDLNELQQKQYKEDFSYFLKLSSTALSFLKHTQYPIHNL